MKRSGSEWDLEEFLRPVVANGLNDDRNPAAPPPPEDLLLRSSPPLQKPRLSAGVFSVADVCGFGFADHPDALSNHANEGAFTGSQIWSQNLGTRPSSISVTIESESSLYAGSPTSSLKPKNIDNQAPGGTSDSDQSDDESLEMDAGSCEQGTNIIDIKRMRRMVSNRESARRSRKRKQAHLTELELQVDQLRGENSSLYKQLTDANHEFTDAVTDNRVLKSDVEALRVKVKMAEDLVTRGSLTCSLDHLLQSPMSAPHLLNSRNLCRASEIPPIIELQENEPCYLSAVGQIQLLGMEGDETKDGNIGMRLNQSSSIESIASLDNLQNRLPPNDVTSCGSDIWQWDSHANAMPKQL
ncbi:basic leucine zipper 9 [Iris pallida]|uniref:Basic leucine zipper 9 n=1 Tax=Iris pallida TaxID=29817 RepID=A0AAX6EIV6_IRIPA|nr:basic leucine zipper 9 [Iris pallida]